MPDDFFLHHVTPTLLDATSGTSLGDGLFAVRAELAPGRFCTVVAERDGSTLRHASLRSGHSYLCDHAMPHVGQAAVLGRVWEVRTVVPGWAVYSFFAPRHHLHCNAYPGKVNAPPPRRARVCVHPTCTIHRTTHTSSPCSQGDDTGVVSLIGVPYTMKKQAKLLERLREAPLSDISTVCARHEPSHTPLPGARKDGTRMRNAVPHFTPTRLTDEMRRRGVGSWPPTTLLEFSTLLDFSAHTVPHFTPTRLTDEMRRRGVGLWPPTTFDDDFGFFGPVPLGSKPLTPVCSPHCA